MRRTRLVQTLIVAILLVGGLTTARAAFTTGSTVVVNGNGDLNDLVPGDGICDAVAALPGSQCGLRAAIQELNAQGPGATPHRIEFDIAGTGPFTITPGSALPHLSVPIEIDGETQAGASCPTSSAPANLMIVLDGSNAGVSAMGLNLAFGSDGSTIRGLVIGSFGGTGVLLSSSDNKVRCNHIGVGADGVSPLGNGGSGLSIEGDGNTIGGQAAHAQRNVIAGNNTQGIRIEPDGENNNIFGNLLGTTADGLSALGNDLGGIYVGGNGNFIGSETSPVPNVVAANNGYGIHIYAGDDNLIRSNFIGLALDGTNGLGNLGPGIKISHEAVGNVVGGSSGEGNPIAFNSGDGVNVEAGFGGTPVQNEIRLNAMYANGGLGIDLGNDGVDVNDSGDNDTGENERQNYPVLTSTPGSLIVQGAIDGHPFTSYQVDVYRSESCDPSGYGEGQQYLVTAVVATGGSGEEGLLVDLMGLVSDGDAITATATDPRGNTSEFSACVTISAPPTATPTPTGTAVPPTNTPPPTTTPTGTPSSPTMTPTPTWTATSGPSPTPTWTATPGPSPTSTWTASPGPSPTPTWTATPGPSPTPTGTVPPGPSPSPTQTGIPSPSPTPTSTLPPITHWLYLPIVTQ